MVRFLDVLAARKDPSGLSGEVLIDGAPQPPNFKCLSGYVVQVSLLATCCKPYRNILSETMAQLEEHIQWRHVQHNSRVQQQEKNSVATVLFQSSWPYYPSQWLLTFVSVTSPGRCGDGDSDGEGEPAILCSAASAPLRAPEREGGQGQRPHHRARPHQGGRR